MAESGAQSLVLLFALIGCLLVTIRGLKIPFVHEYNLFAPLYLPSHDSLRQLVSLFISFISISALSRNIVPLIPMVESPTPGVSGNRQ